MVESIKILIVEDLELAQKIAKMTLTTMGCEVDLAHNGSEAVKLANENFYNLIFMDLGLPDIDGLEATRRIRQAESIEKHVPIVILTANSKEAYKDSCLTSDMDDFLIKPLNKEKAQAMLNKFVLNKT